MYDDSGMKFCQGIFFGSLEETGVLPITMACITQDGMLKIFVVSLVWLKALVVDIDELPEVGNKDIEGIGKWKKRRFCDRFLTFTVVCDNVVVFLDRSGN